MIRRLVNLRMKEGSSVTNHVNEFNLIISRLILVERIEDEVMALLLLSSLLDSWSGIVTVVSSSIGGVKISFEAIGDLILGDDVRRQSVGEASNSLLSTKDRGRKSNKGGGGRGRLMSRKRGQSNNRKDITC